MSSFRLQSVSAFNSCETFTDQSSMAFYMQRGKDGLIRREEVVPWSPDRHKLLIMVTLALVCFCVSLDASVIVTSLSAIVADLEGTSTEGFWIGTAYLLSTAVSMPFVSSLSDIFGRPICLEVGISLFTAGSLICSLARNVTVLLVGRSIQGIGGGSIIVLSLVIFTDIVPLRYRPKWYGMVMGAWALGNCIGPTIGGLIAQKTTWRWVFYIMLPFCGYGLVSVPFLLTLKPKQATLAEKLGRVDWFGSFIFIASATSLLIAISWGGSQFPWKSVQTIVPLAAGVIGLVLTGVWERVFASNPIFSYQLFHNLSSLVTYICGSIQGLILFGLLYYGPFFFLSAKGFTPVHTGVAMLPTVFFLAPIGVITGVAVTRFNNYQWPVWVGWAVLTGSCAMLSWLWDDKTSTAVWVVTEIVIGIGHGCILNAQNFATQAMCKPGDEGAAASMYLFARQFGMALGVGIGGTTFQNVMTSKLRSLGQPEAIAANAEAFVAQLHQIPASEAKAQIIQAYVSGFQGVFRVYLGLSIAGFLLSLLIKHFDMNKPMVTKHLLEDTYNVSGVMSKKSSISHLTTHSNRSPV